MIGVEDGWVGKTIFLRTAIISMLIISGIQSCLLFNNLSVAISAGLLIISLSDVYNVYYLLSIAGSILFCSIALASASGEKTAFSKDWVVVMSSSLYKNEEVNINSNVDGDVLFTKILSSE